MRRLNPGHSLCDKMLARAFVIGVDHHTCPVQVREALAKIDHPNLLQTLKAAGVEDAFVLSTCNRFEVYGTAACHGTVPYAFTHTLQQAGVRADSIYTHAYHKRGEAMLRHGFGVAASLESMVVGEPQILGQMKDAWQAANLGGFMNRFGQAALRVGKRVRHETGIGREKVSVAATAVDLARQVHGNITHSTVLLVGAGDMAIQAAEHLQAAGVAAIQVCNRSPERAESLARQFQATPRPWAQLDEALAQADVVITSTGSQTLVLTHDRVAQAMKKRRNKPMFIVDIAVPRDVDPTAHELENCFVYDIDQLGDLTNQALSQRHGFVAAAQAIVEEELQSFVAWSDSREQVALLNRMRHHFEEARLDVLSRGELTADEATRLLVNKLLHHPLTQLKAAPSRELPDAAIKLFGLE